MNCLICVLCSSKVIILYEILIQFWAVTDVSMIIIISKYGSECSDKPEKKGLSKNMLEYLKNKKGPDSFWLVHTFIVVFFFVLFFMNEKCWKQHGGTFWPVVYHHFIFLLNTCRAFFYFYLGTFLKVDIDITTPRRSHLTQLPIVFYAEKSGGELR